MKVFFVTIILSIAANAGLLYTYNQLTLKDLDQMNALVKGKLKESKATYSGKTVPLKEGLQAIFSRPNSDDMIEKVLPPLRTALDQEEAREKTYTELVTEAINALTNTKNFKKEVQVTYSIFLENVISEFKPNLRKDGFEFKIVKKIADADIELTSDAQKDRKLRLMQESASPSAIAAKVLADFEEQMAKKPEVKPETEELPEPKIESEVENKK